MYKVFYGFGCVSDMFITTFPVFDVNEQIFINKACVNYDINHCQYKHLHSYVLLSCIFDLIKFSKISPKILLYHIFHAYYIFSKISA